MGEGKYKSAAYAISSTWSSPPVSADEQKVSIDEVRHHSSAPRLYFIRYRLYILRILQSYKS